MKVLVAPLDWGLGHATRSIPVIRTFLDLGYTVDLAVSGRISALYSGEFPNLRQISIPSYSIQYPERGFEMPFWVLKNYAKIASVIREEHKVAESLVKKNGYDILFSDNRFGFYSKSAISIYMTHQVCLAFPKPFSLLECLGIAWHKRIMKNFDRVWIPDFPNFPGMAGKLSHLRDSSKFDYIGLLSRFETGNDSFLNAKEYEIMGVISGPEPMRTAFEKKLLAALSEIPGKHIVLLGKPGETTTPKASKNVLLFNHLETAAFRDAVEKSRTIVSRSGYSTVMDMAILGASSIFIPTPGQTEQVYLGKTLATAGDAGFISQHNLNGSILRRFAKKKFCIRFPENSKNLLLSAMYKLKDIVK